MQSATFERNLRCAIEAPCPLFTYRTGGAEAACLFPHTADEMVKGFLRISLHQVFRDAISSARSTSVRVGGSFDQTSTHVEITTFAFPCVGEDVSTRERTPQLVMVNRVRYGRNMDSMRVKRSNRDEKKTDAFFLSAAFFSQNLRHRNYLSCAGTAPVGVQCLHTCSGAASVRVIQWLVQ